MLCILKFLFKKDKSKRKYGVSFIYMKWLTLFPIIRRQHLRFSWSSSRWICWKLTKNLANYLAQALFECYPYPLNLHTLVYYSNCNNEQSNIIPNTSIWAFKYYFYSTSLLFRKLSKYFFLFLRYISKCTRY